MSRSKFQRMFRSRKTCIGIARIEFGVREHYPSNEVRRVAGHCLA